MWKYLPFLILCACPDLPGSVELGLTYRSQLKSNWCWAACGAMIREVPQYSIVTEVFGSPENYSAGLGAGLGDVPEQFYKSQLTEYTLKFSLAAGDPIGLGYSGHGASHFVLLDGYSGDLFTVYDPGAGVSYQTYNELLALDNMVWDETHVILK